MPTLLGDTYPQRETLKRWGARFSSKRRAWYYVGWELPDSIKQLITEYATIEPEPTPQLEDDAPCSDEEAERILGVQLAPKSSAVFNDNVPIQPGETGVLDAQGFHKTDETTAEGVSDTELAPADEETTVSSDEPDKPPSIRVYKPQSLPDNGTPLDEVQTAIVQAKLEPMAVLHPVTVSQKRTLVSIGQSYVGELTGSITGNVYCYGYAIHDGICVFVNMGGPRMAVEAIRAKLSKGDIVNCTPWDAAAVELTAGEGSSGMYHDFVRRGKRS